MKIPNTVSTNRITLLIDDKPKTIAADHPNFELIIKELRKKDHSRVIDLINETVEKKIEKSIKNYDGVRISENDFEIMIGNSWHTIHSYVTDYIVEEFKSGNENIDHLVKFVKKIFENPSKNSVEQLYPFLEKQNLVIDEDGDVFAYKGLREDFYSIHSNKNTIVLKGVVDNEGSIYNGIGEEIEVARNCVVDDPNKECAEGIHVGSYSFAARWANGGRVVLVKFNPKDAVSVPNSNFQKCRVCKYKVIKEIAEEKTSPVAAKGKNKPLNIKEKIINYIDKKIKENGGIQIGKINKNLKTGLTSEQIFSIVKSAGYSYTYGNNENHHSRITVSI